MAQIIRSPHPSTGNGAQPGQNVATLIESNPHNAPDNKPAYVRAHDGKALTRKQLFDASHSLAWSLRNVLHATPGTRVAIFSPNSCWYAPVALANLCAGLTTVTLNSAYNIEELSHPLADSRPEYIVAAPALVPVARGAMEKAGLPSRHPRSGKPTLWIMSDADEMARGDQGESDIRTLVDEAKGQRLEAVRIDDPKTTDAFIGYSSGTSGKPKGVQLTHSNFISLIQQYPTARFGELDPNHVALGALPFAHIFALAHSVILDLYLGITVIVMPRFELEPFLKYVQRYKVNRLEVVPPMLVLLAKNPLVDEYDLSSLVLMMSGAAPLSAELGDKVEARLNAPAKGGNVRICQGYGLTETSPSTHASEAKSYHRTKGSVGTLLPHVEARLVDESGKDVGHEQGSQGKPGELWVRGPTIMKGYLNRPDATRDAVDPEGWFKTGDVAIAPVTDATDPALRGRGYGQHFWIVDRVKELIKVKGFQVAPAEMEALLLEHPDVSDAACVGVYDEAEATEFPLAFIVPAADWKGPHEELAKKVRQWVDSRVAGHKKLRAGVQVRAEIPKSPSGKILRRLLRDEVAAAAKAKQGGAQPVKAKL